jgi:hypothetical protein
MATRALIAMTKTDQPDEILYQYAHYDNYPQRMGDVLKVYDSPESVFELLSMGEASFIDENLQKSKFYARDYGETLKRPKSCLKERWDDVDAGVDWYYLYDSNEKEWYYGRNERSLRLL